MDKKNIILFCFLTLGWLGGSSWLHATTIEEFTHPAILSFEKNIAPAEADSNSTLSISAKHYKHQQNSLKWEWTAPNAQWFIRMPIEYSDKNTYADNNAVATFVFWIYAEKATPNDKIRVEFLKDDKICCYFDYATDFTGWRGAWIAFDRDMEGTPQPGMDEIRITAPQTPHGEFYFDHIIPVSFQDVRHHTADFQAPYINPETNSHWLILLSSWQNAFETEIADELAADEKNGMSTIENRLTDLLLGNRKAQSLEQLKKDLGAYQIKQNEDGSLSGLPIFFERYGETYSYLGAAPYNVIYNNPMGLVQANKLLDNLAVAYHRTDNQQSRQEIAQMYVLFMRHMLDQGFQAGSAMGTLHHLGYSMRNFYVASFLMRDVLEEAGLKKQVQQAMEWFSGAGEVKKIPNVPGMDIDAFNTSLVPRLSSILMLDDTPEKAAYLYCFARWIDNGMAFSDGTAGSFKIDGTIFHHRHNYPAYAIGGLEGAVNAVTLLHKTAFALQQTSHEHLKNALLTMRTYCNLQTWPLSLSGRHPDGKGHLIPEQFARLAACGSPDGTQEIDRELAAAYLRLVQNNPTGTARKFIQNGIEPEASPNGNWAYNYSCLAVHRRNTWSATAMGHSRYLWATESYIGANLYGRYLNHGNLQILSKGNPISNFGSGFRQEGWDWNHFPGTTATEISMQDLKADIKNVDENSGYEEMLLSDETFAGAITIGQRNGAFGMKLHEHDKYNGSLRARKSYFFFDNRIVALGSGICSELPENPVHTTLFQVFLENPEQGISIANKEITDFPFEATFNNTLTQLSDGMDNYFFIRNGQVHVQKTLQHSMHEETGQPTENNFALAYIDHGNAPENGKYEYMILIQPEQEELAKTAIQMASPKKAPYTVLQHSAQAHIVRDNQTQTTGYILFDAGEIGTKTTIKSVDTPCMAMTAETSEKEMTLSVCDPDLHFYEGPADEIYDEQGKRIERSVYSRTWIDNPSGISQIKITLRGQWMPTEESEFFQLIKSDKNCTIFAVTCQHGFSREIKLHKK